MKKTFLGAVRIPKIVDKDGNIIHLEENQSENTVRPIFLCPGKETAKGDLVRALVERMDREAEENQTIIIDFGDVSVTINIQYHPGGDGKAAQTASGLLGKSKQFGPDHLMISLINNQHYPESLSKSLF